jgi:predicted aldo/keto reductase-like oxidoreductase
MSMDNYSLIDNYVAASGKRIEREDLALLQKYRDAIDSSYCRLSCSVCEDSCPNNVAISDIMRFIMYFEDYGQQKKAIDQYNTLTSAQKPIICQRCPGHCMKSCPYGLQVKEQLLRAHKLMFV